MIGENEEIRDEKIKKIEQLKQMGLEPFPYSYQKDTNILDIINEFAGTLAPETKTEKSVKIAGRITSVRLMGKVVFMDIQDEDAKIQLFFRKDEIGDKFDLAKLIDIGDIIGAEGVIFVTRAGELSVAVKDFMVLVKSLTGIADSYYGLKDIELKYRNRSMDLIANQDSRDILKKRFIITSKVREFMTSEGFLEVETPINQIVYGGAAAKPFVTHHDKLDLKMYLRVSPEQYLKRLLVGGLERVYEIGKSFRNENIDRTHNPEFTMLEAYAAYKDYNFMMDLAERLIEKLLMEVVGQTEIEYMGHKIDFKKPWRRLAVKDALREIAEIDVDRMSDEELFSKVDETKKEFKDKNRGTATMILFEHFCEDKLIDPTHIIDFPKESTVFCKVHRENPDLIERFESYAAGIEFTNGYSELNDAVLQRKLLENQEKLKNEGAEETWGELDEEFLQAMDTGMPPAAGIGIGIDRIAMILLNQASIRDIIYFPTMKPIQTDNYKLPDSNDHLIK